jgi:hypothetical protein
MATKFGSVSLPRKNTNGSAAPSFDTYGEYTFTRISNQELQVTIAVTFDYKGSGGSIGESSYLDAGIYATVSSNGINSEKLTIKKSNEKLTFASGFKKTVEATLIVPSDTAGVPVSVSYSITNGGASWVTFAKTTQSTTFSSPQLLYTKCGAPATFSINTDNAKTNTDVVLSWTDGTEGINNPVVGYELQQAIGGQGYSTIGTVTDKSKTVRVAATVGATIYFRVRTIGAVAGYESDYSNVVSCTIINTEPIITNLKINKTKVSAKGESVIFSWNGFDADGEILEYYWNLSDNEQLGEWTPIGSATSININVGPKSNRAFLIYATDSSGGTSETAKIDLIYNNIPSVPTIVESSGSYVKFSRFSWNPSLDEDNDKISYRVYRSIDENDFVYVGKTDALSYSEEISQELIGKKIIYKITSNDGIDESGFSNSYFVYRNTPPSAPSGLSISPSGLVVPGVDSIAESHVKVNWELPTGGTSDVKQYVLEQSITTNSGNTLWTPLATISKDILEYELNVSNVARGSYIKIRIKAVDVLGEESNFSDASNIIRKNEAPLLGALTISATGTIQVWENPFLSVTWQRMITDDAGGIYELKLISAQGKSYILGRIEANEKDNEYTYSIPLSAEEEISVILSELYGSTVNGIINNNRIEIVAYDGFGVPSTPSYTEVSFDFRFVPKMDEDTGLYVIKKMSLSGEPATNLESGLYAMVNSGESVRLVFPKAKDLNTSDLEKMTYTIKSIRSERLNYFVNEKIEEYQDMLSIAANRLGVDAQGKYYYDYAVPNVAKNTIVKFAIEATDSTNLNSNIIVFPNGIEICRVTSPDFLLESCNWYKVEGVPVGFSVSSVLISNGGSLIDSSRGLTYADRRNLERNPKNKLFKLELEYSDVANFSTFNTITLVDLDKEENYYYSDNSWPRVINKEDANLNASTSKFIRLKLSIRDAVSVNTGLKTVYSSVIILHANAPALSGRITGVGISNANPEGRLHVSPQKENEVAIFGNEHQGSGYTRFIINLSTGEMIAGIIDPGDLDSEDSGITERILLSSDGYILVDSNGTYLTAKGWW